MTTDHNLKEKYWIYDLRLLININLSFYIAIILLFFFEGDIIRIFTPFIYPFLCLALPLIFFILVIISIIHILPQTEDMTWKSYLPLLINLATLCSMLFFYEPLGNLRIDIGFRINEKRFNQTVSWITQLIQNGDINQDDNWEIIKLPKEYRSLAEDGRVDVIYEYGVTTIIFYRGGGMFELYPSFVYRSDNIATPFEALADTICSRRISPYWYDCY